jgi:hypothetical protein
MYNFKKFTDQRVECTVYSNRSLQDLNGNAAYINIIVKFGT